MDFKAEEMRVATLETGYFALDGGAMFGHVPKALWSKKITPNTDNTIALGLRVLLVQTPEYNLLVDSGMGDKWAPEMAQRFSLNVTPWKKLLSPFKLSEADITHVLVTHLHFDHAGGLTKADENGHLVPTFPNAEILVSQENYDFAINPSIRESASYQNENWECLEKLGQLRLVQLGSKDSIEVLKKCWVGRSDGHTIGQQIPIFETPKGMVSFCGDLIPTQHHASLNWGMGYDGHANMLLQEKRKFLEKAVLEDWTLVLEHDQQNTVYRVEKKLTARMDFMISPKSF